MLPGLRILFAIILLSVSVLIFGLGAAAYLRSAHEHFASTPWRPIEAPATARVDLAPPTLAMLRVEPETVQPLPAQQLDAPAAVSAPIEANVAARPISAAQPAADASPASAVPAAVPDAARPVAPEPASTAPVEDKSPQAAQEVAEPRPALEALPDAPIATATAETRAAEAKPAETSEATPAPAQVAVVDADTTSAPAEDTADAAPVATPSPAIEASTIAAAPAATASATDTLKADDKAIEPAPPAKIAALGEPVLAQTPPLPPKDVKIPNPRVDPAEVEARRKRLLAQQRARARAAQARRAAAARARAAAEAKATAGNPFGAPINTTGTN